MTEQHAAVVLGGAQVSLPALFTPAPDAGKRAVEFLTANIRNPNSRDACTRAATDFAAWCMRFARTNRPTSR